MENKKEIKTERLLLRPIEENDWESVRKIWEDFKKSEYVFYDRPKNTDGYEVKKRIATWADANRKGNDHIFYAAVFEGVVIGFISMNRFNDGYEIGYGFLDPYKRKGYAKESISALLCYMKDLGAKKIYAGTALDNLPSARLLYSLGFTLSKKEKTSFYKDENGNDIVFEGGSFVKEL